MKKIMLFILFSCITLSLVSCDKNTVKKTLSEKVATIASDVLVDELECSNADLVYTDVKIETDKLFQVEANSLNAKATNTNVLICKTVTGALLPVVFDLAKQGKLSEWGCTVSEGQEKITELVYKGCDKLAPTE